MKKIFSTIFIFSLLPLRSFANVNDVPLQVDEYDSKYLLSDIASPITTKADRILFSGTGLLLVSLAIEHSTNEQFQKSTSTTKPLGGSSKFGDRMGQLIPNAAYSLGMLGAYYISDDASVKAKSLHRAFFMLETSAYASVASGVLKYAIREPRPDTSDRYSFPSGHSTTIFSFAGVVGLEHEWYYSIPAYALASFVGFSRINDNKHFLHDVLGGATVGLSYAYGIWYNRHQDQTKSTSELFILPTDDLSGSVFSWKMEF